MPSANKDLLRIGMAQIAPLWLNRERTTAKITSFIEKAADEGCEFITFGEGLLPGYPFWLARTEGARFNSPMQKDIHAHYVDQAVRIDAGDLLPICQVAAGRRIAVMLGCIERPADRGGYSLYCSRVFIDADGAIGSVHRKLMPTYEERLSWSPGDGHGLRVHPLGPFKAGGLNCWENWMPLPRASLYAQGEDLHVALWPGGHHNTYDITRFIAKEGRCYVISVSGLMRKQDVPSNMPHAASMLANCPDWLANGGSCLAGPDGEWIIEPVIEQESLLFAVLDASQVRRERHNLDVAGHYSRPDVLQLNVDRSRQRAAYFNDEAG